MNLGRLESVVREAVERISGKKMGDTEITEYLNQGQRDFAYASNLLHGVATIETEVDGQRYVTPSNMIKPVRLTYNRKRIVFASRDDLDRAKTDGTWDEPFYQVGAATLTTGSGLDDITAGGIYTGTDVDTYTITVDATGTPDTFTWAVDGTNVATTVSMSTSAVTLQDGVTVLWAANTGHDSSDVWTFTVGQTPYVSSNSWTNFTG